MVFTLIITHFLKFTIESWCDWDLDLRPLNTVQALQPTELSDNELNSNSEPTFYGLSNFIVCLVSDFILASAFEKRHVYVN